MRTRIRVRYWILRQYIRNDFYYAMWIGAWAIFTLSDLWTRQWHDAWINGFIIFLLCQVMYYRYWSKVNRITRFGRGVK